MNTREAYLGMIKAMSGGWGAMCGALAMTRDALENRIYERKGQGVSVDTALAMQSFSGTTLFAEAICTASGGVFLKLPEIELGDRDVLMNKFNELYTELGQYHKDLKEAIEDEVVDKGERRILESGTARIQRVVAEMNAVVIRLYCPNQGQPDSDGAR